MRKSLSLSVKSVDSLLNTTIFDLSHLTHFIFEAVSPEKNGFVDRHTIRPVLAGTVPV